MSSMQRLACSVQHPISIINNINNINIIGIVIIVITVNFMLAIYKQMYAASGRS
jgi:hypothetical protein